MVHDRPNDPDVWWHLAQATDELEQRIQCLEMTLRLQPGHTAARQLLAQTKLQLAKSTPVDGRQRPTLDTEQQGYALVIQPERAPEIIRKKQRKDSRSRTTLWILGFGSLAAIAAVMTLAVAILARPLASQPPSTPLAAKSLTLNVEGCISGGGAVSQLTFVNQTVTIIGIARGEAGSEEFVAALEPGSQITVDVLSGEPVRYSAQGDTPGAPNGGAVIEIPPGSSCTVPVR